MRSRVDPAALAFRGIWLGGLLLVSATSWAGPAPVDTLTLFRGEAIIQGDGTAGPFRLPDRLIIAGTERIERGGRTLRPGLDYQLDAVRGALSLTLPLASGQILYVRYERFPYELEPEYSHRQIRFVADTLGVPAPGLPTRRAGPTRGLAELTVAGNKTFSVEIGSNRDVTLKQALNLSISGSLARDVEVRAVLSDTDIPLQPEGTTQELEQLDNVLVEVKSTHLSATLGDYDVSVRGSRFANLERQLEGVLGRAEYDRVRVGVAGALSKGKFASMEFRGEEGRQGPYQLLSNEGSRDIVVVAGSERVSIFGERVVRGENNDYTIDYEEGTIQFTSKRLISEDSEIAVDYEFMTEDYKRGLYFGETDVRGLVGGRVDLGASVFSERDQASRPVARELSAAEREILAASGDAEVWISGATEVGEGGGPYDWVEVAPGESCFVWVGSDSGRFAVRFTELPDSSGQYVRRFDAGAGRFVYECTGRGPYVPLLRLPSPQAHTLADVRWAVRGSERVTASGEVAVSSLDGNTLSERDDGDNVGTVLEAGLGLREKPIGLAGQSLGRVSLTGTLRSREERFRPLGRTEVPYYGKRWNLTSTSPQRAERVREAELLYEPRDGAELHLTYGRLDQGSDVTSVRREGLALQDWGRGTRVSYLFEEIDSWDNRPGGDLLRKTRRSRSEASARLWRVLSRFSYEHDARDRGGPDSLLWGLRFDEVRLSTSLVEAPGWSTSLDLGRRENDEVLLGVWVPKSVSKTAEIALKHQRSNSLSAAAAISHREVVYDARWQEADVTTDLADLSLRHALLGGRLKNNVNYRISNATRTVKERHFVYVGEGADYDSLGNFVDGEGFYEPVTVPGVERPVIEVVASARLTWDPRARGPGTAVRRGGESLGWIRHVGSETFVKVDERTTTTDRWRVYLLDPGALQQDDTTLDGRVTLREDIFLFRDHPAFSIRLRYEFSNIEDNRLSGLLREIGEGQRTVLFRGAPTQSLGLEVEYLNRWRAEEVEEGGRVEREDRRSHGLRLQVTQWLGQRARLAIRSALESTTDRAQDQGIRTLEVAPTLTYSFLGKGRAECGATWREASGEDRTGPFSRIGWIGRPGWEWTLGADYRIGRYVTASLTYSGTRLEGRDAIHSGRSELRAYF